MIAGTLDEQIGRLFNADRELIRDPWPLYQELVDAGPVHVLDDRVLLTAHATVKLAMRDGERFVHSGHMDGADDPQRNRLPTDDHKRMHDEIRAFEALYMSRRDGADHDRLRAIAHRAFTPRKIADLGEVAQRYMDETLDAADPDETLDLMDLAYQLPIKVIGDLLGLPHEDRARFHEWTNRIGENLHPPGGAAIVTEAHRAHAEFQGYVKALLGHHRAGAVEPSFLVEQFMDAEQGDHLSPQELTAMFIVLTFGGSETTTNLISIGMQELLKHPDQWQRLCEAPELAPKATEELLRWVTPFQFGGRITADEVEVGGTVVAPGTRLVLMHACANRDPEAFADPRSLDIRRDDARNHLGLGFASHYCLGASLARLEGAIAFRTFAERFPDMELMTADLPFVGTAPLRKLASLPVRLGRDRGRRRR